ncbi:MAG: hypothetical protein ACRC20_10155 [Segniliparus sp.]|uniref:hypothetical protein n=1 Tax=Segniliparus sp. TaxID=2804064 RepID=UPI003F3A7298
MTQLVGHVRKLGIEIPKQVESEIGIYKDLLRSRSGAEREYDDAVGALRTVDPSKFQDAKAEVVAKSFQWFALNQGVDKVLIDAAATRLHNAVYDAVGGWEREIVSRFNSVVEGHALNETAPDLPALSDPRGFNAWNLTEQQARAVQAWREAATLLDPLWSAYRRIADYHGYQIGPAKSDDLSTNLFSACALGDPGAFSTAYEASIELARIGENVDTARPYAAITPYVVTAIARYPLRLHTIADAAKIRASIQPS